MSSDPGSDDDSSAVVAGAVVVVLVAGAVVTGAVVMGAVVVGAVDEAGGIGVVVAGGCVGFGGGVTLVTGPTPVDVGAGLVELEPDGVTSVELTGSEPPSPPQATPSEAHRDTKNDRRNLDGFLMVYVG